MKYFGGNETTQIRCWIVPEWGDLGVAWTIRQLPLVADKIDSYRRQHTNM